MAKAKSKAVVPADESPPEFERPAWLKLGEALTYNRVPFDWAGRIVRNSVNLIDADKGSGKSTVMAALAVAMCSGRKLPGEKKPGPKGRCLWFGSEERADEQILPRWVAAGGVSDQIRVIDVTDCRHDDRPYLPGDVDSLIETLVRQSARVLVLDPFSALNPPTIDLNTTQPARVYQEALLHVAAAASVTILQGRHLGKNRRQSALSQGQGNMQIAAGCRSLLRIDRHPDSPDRRILSTVACNYAAPAPPIAFDLCVPADGWVTLKWGREEDKTLEEVMEGAGDAGEIDEERDADKLLRGLLASGPVDFNVVKEEAMNAGVNLSALRRAKPRLGIKSIRKSKGAKGAGNWSWSFK